MNLTEFHLWLFDKCRRSPTTVLDIMEDVADYGEHLPSWMPTNGIVCQEMLEKLEKQGMAKRDGSWWMWTEKPEPVVEKPKESQRSLFA
jgi:hypothetical protein